MISNEIRVGPSRSEQGFERGLRSTFSFVAIGEVEDGLGVLGGLGEEGLETVPGARPFLAVHGHKPEVEVSAVETRVDPDGLLEVPSLSAVG